MTDYTTSIPTSDGFIKTYVEQVTLRDQFAMAAMAAVIARYGSLSTQAIAEDAYQVADAMLEARKEKK